MTFEGELDAAPLVRWARENGLSARSDVSAIVAYASDLWPDQRDALLALRHGLDIATGDAAGCSAARVLRQLQADYGDNPQFAAWAANANARMHNAPSPGRS